MKNSIITLYHIFIKSLYYKIYMESNHTTSFPKNLIFSSKKYDKVPPYIFNPYLISGFGIVGLEYNFLMNDFIQEKYYKKVNTEYKATLISHINVNNEYNNLNYDICPDYVFIGGYPQWKHSSKSSPPYCYSHVYVNGSFYFFVYVFYENIVKISNNQLFKYSNEVVENLSEIWVPKAFVVVSHYPYFSLYNKICYLTKKQFTKITQNKNKTILSNNNINPGKLNAYNNNYNNLDSLSKSYHNSLEQNSSIINTNLNLSYQSSNQESMLNTQNQSYYFNKQKQSTAKVLNSLSNSNSTSSLDYKSNLLSKSKNKAQSKSPDKKLASNNKHSTHKNSSGSNNNPNAKNKSKFNNVENSNEVVYKKLLNISVNNLKDRVDTIIEVELLNLLLLLPIPIHYTYSVKYLSQELKISQSLQFYPTIDFNLCEIISAQPINLIIKSFILCLFEKNVIFVSENIQYLTLFIQSVVSFLYPFFCGSTQERVMTVKLGTFEDDTKCFYKIIDNPNSIIIGLNEKLTPKIIDHIKIFSKDTLLEERVCYLVDLDESKVEILDDSNLLGTNLDFDKLLNKYLDVIEQERLITNSKIINSNCTKSVVFESIFNLYSSLSTFIDQMKTFNSNNNNYSFNVLNDSNVNFKLKNSKSAVLSKQSQNNLNSNLSLIHQTSAISNIYSLTSHSFYSDNNNNNKHKESINTTKITYNNVSPDYFKNLFYYNDHTDDRVKTINKRIQEEFYGCLIGIISVVYNNFSLIDEDLSGNSIRNTSSLQSMHESHFNKNSIIIPDNQEVRNEEGNYSYNEFSQKNTLASNFTNYTQNLNFFENNNNQNYEEKKPTFTNHPIVNKKTKSRINNFIIDNTLVITVNENRNPSNYLEEYYRLSIDNRFCHSIVSGSTACTKGLFENFIPMAKDRECPHLDVHYKIFEEFLCLRKEKLKIQSDSTINYFEILDKIRSKNSKSSMNSRELVIDQFKKLSTIKKNFIFDNLVINKNELIEKELNINNYSLNYPKENTGDYQEHDIFYNYNNNKYNANRQYKHSKSNPQIFNFFNDKKKINTLKRRFSNISEKDHETEDDLCYIISKKSSTKKCPYDKNDPSIKDIEDDIESIPSEEMQMRRSNTQTILYYNRDIMYQNSNSNINIDEAKNKEKPNPDNYNSNNLNNSRKKNSRFKKIFNKQEKELEEESKRKISGNSNNKSNVISKNVTSPFLSRIKNEEHSKSEQQIKNIINNSSSQEIFALPNNSQFNINDDYSKKKNSNIIINNQNFIYKRISKIPVSSYRYQLDRFRNVHIQNKYLTLNNNINVNQYQNSNNRTRHSIVSKTFIERNSISSSLSFKNEEVLNNLNDILITSDKESHVEFNNYILFEYKKFLEKNSVFNELVNDYIVKNLTKISKISSEEIIDKLMSSFSKKGLLSLKYLIKYSIYSSYILTRLPHISSFSEEIFDACQIIDQIDEENQLPFLRKYLINIMIYYNQNYKFESNERISGEMIVLSNENNSVATSLISNISANRNKNDYITKIIKLIKEKKIVPNNLMMEILSKINTFPYNLNESNKHHMEKLFFKFELQDNKCIDGVKSLKEIYAYYEKRAEKVDKYHFKCTKCNSKGDKVIGILLSINEKKYNACLLSPNRIYKNCENLIIKYFFMKKKGEMIEDNIIYRKELHEVLLNILIYCKEFDIKYNNSFIKEYFQRLYIEEKMYTNK